MGRKLSREPSSGDPTPAHVTLAVVLQVRGATLQVLLWRRAREPDKGHWALPGGYLEAGETLEDSIRRHLADKVDVRELSHLEQLETLSDPGRSPQEWQLATAYLGLVPRDLDPELPDDTAWHPVDDLPQLAFDHESIVLAGRERLRAKLSYTNLGFALAPQEFAISELRDLYAAALGHDVSATNLRTNSRSQISSRSCGRRDLYGSTWRSTSAWTSRPTALVEWARDGGLSRRRARLDPGRAARL
jgi:ADP-ribose pyrophosphatase YjhB (NUDIX family)